RRRPESSFALALWFRSSALLRGPTHVHVWFVDIPGRRSHSLARARESNQREHALGSAPLAARGVRYGRTGFAHRASCPVVEIGALPGAARVRSTRLVRSPFAAAQRGPKAHSREVDGLNLDCPHPSPLPQAGEGIQQRVGQGQLFGFALFFAL